MQRFTLLLFVLLSSLFCNGFASKESSTPQGKNEPVVRANWVIDNRFLNPDCKLRRPTAVVNGKMPGPEVHVVSGTRLLITVTNKQKYPVTIHWHGITQHNSQWHDGVGGVTQCNIEKGMTFTYNFSTAGHVGTLWWHAHTAMIRGTVFGALIVHEATQSERPVPMSREKVFMLTDWFHLQPTALEKKILGSPFQGFPVGDAMLINGRSKCTGYDAMAVQPGKWHRVRVVNAALYATLNFVIQGHRIWTYEAEGGRLKPVAFTSFDIMSGQSHSFLVKANQRPGTYWVMARPRYDVEGFDLVPGTAIMHYIGSPMVTPSLTYNKEGNILTNGPTIEKSPRFTRDQNHYTRGAVPVPDWIDKVDKLVMFQLNMHILNKTLLRYSINNVSLTNPKAALLAAEYFNIPNIFSSTLMPPLPPAGFQNAIMSKECKSGVAVVDVPYNSVVQLVMQNFIPPGLNHPLHLHGFNFFEVATGSGYFNWRNWRKYKYNTVDPVFRNTMWLLEGTWHAVRFKADNPGIWLMHCHLEPHVDGGMAFILRVRKPGGGLPAPPKDYPQCPGYPLNIK